MEPIRKNVLIFIFQNSANLTLKETMRASMNSLKILLISI